MKKVFDFILKNIAFFLILIVVIIMLTGCYFFNAKYRYNILNDESSDQIKLSYNDKITNNSNSSDITNSNDKDEDNNDSNNNSNNNSNTNESNDVVSDDNESSNNRGCEIIVSKGTLGNNNWYKSKVTLSMKIKGSKVSNYGLTTSNSISYNKKKELEITSSHKQKKYYGYVKYSDGEVSKCDVSIKVDLGKPTVPNSEIRKYNQNGKKLSNTSAYRNYKVWWGNFNGTDNISGVDHYEYSINCNGSKNGNLNNSYYFPLSNKNISNNAYCIRTVDKAGNYSNWSSKYYFNIDEVKPSCSITMTTGSNKDTLKITSKESGSGIYGYSYDNSKYYSGTTYDIAKGRKVTVYVKDKAGNIGTCTNHRTALIIVGDSRTSEMMQHLGGKKFSNYEDIYFIESYDNIDVFMVAKAGATSQWLIGRSNGTYNSGAYQVHYLINYLYKKNIYYDIKIGTNLGVNDLNYGDPKESPTKAAKEYISIYKNLLNSSQKVYYNSQVKNSHWKKGGTILNVELYFISANPINEQLLNNYFGYINRTNVRTNGMINNYNRIMRQTFGRRYIDAHSQFDSWFKAADEAGKSRYVVKSLVVGDKKVVIQDGIHYSAYLNKNYIYPFYKSKLLEN